MQHITDGCKNEDITYHFDKKGNITEEASKTETPGGKSVINRTVYHYQKDKVTLMQQLCNDTLVSEEISDYKGRDLIHFKRTLKGQTVIDESYVYSKPGKLQRITTITPQGTDVQEITYDSKDRIKETVTSRNGVMLAKEKEYNFGNTTTIEYFTKSFAKPELVKTIVYDFDGNIIDERSEKNGVEISRIITRYEVNILASRKEYSYSKLIWEMLYDEYGNPLKETRYDTDEVLVYENKFNPNFHLKEVKVLKGGNLQCEKTLSNEYW